MSKIWRFLRLIRWPNLAILLLVQFLFIRCLIYPYQIMLPPLPLYALCLASVLAAAAGNIINDYYDQQIDLVNKPEKVIIGKHMTATCALIMYFLLNILAVACAFFSDWYLGLTQISGFVWVGIILLWLYSRYWKRTFLLGNIIVALLTALPLLMITRVETAVYGKGAQYPLLILYIFFAFWVSLIREIIKDCEDVNGDQLGNARTIPIVLGLKGAKLLLGTFIILLIMVFLVLLGSVITFQFWLLALCLITLIILMWYLWKRIRGAQEPPAFHAASSLAKIIMLIGTLSMLLVRYYIHFF